MQGPNGDWAGSENLTIGFNRPRLWAFHPYVYPFPATHRPVGEVRATQPPRHDGGRVAAGTGEHLPIEKAVHNGARGATFSPPPKNCPFAITTFIRSPPMLSPVPTDRSEG